MRAFVLDPRYFLRPSIEEVSVKPLSQEALFRYQVVSLIRARILGGVRRVTAVA